MRCCLLLLYAVSMLPWYDGFLLPIDVIGILTEVLGSLGEYLCPRWSNSPTAVVHVLGEGVQLSSSSPQSCDCSFSFCFSFCETCSVERMFMLHKSIYHACWLHNKRCGRVAGKLRTQKPSSGKAAMSLPVACCGSRGPLNCFPLLLFSHSDPAGLFKRQEPQFVG